LWRSGLLVPLFTRRAPERRGKRDHRRSSASASATARVGVTPSDRRRTRPLRKTTSITAASRRQRSSADPRRRRPLLPRPERSDIRLEPPPRAQRSKGRGVLAAAMHEVGWDECRAGARPRQRSPRAPGTPPPSAASQPTSTAVAAPDRKAPVAVIAFLPINLQINEQTSHAETRSDRWPSPDAYCKSEPQVTVKANPAGILCSRRGSGPSNGEGDHAFSSPNQSMVAW
jgi:hypothetical protein